MSRILLRFMRVLLKLSYSIKSTSSSKALTWIWEKVLKKIEAWIYYHNKAPKSDKKWKWLKYIFDKLIVFLIIQAQEYKHKTMRKQTQVTQRWSAKYGWLPSTLLRWRRYFRSAPHFPHTPNISQHTLTFS